MPILITEAAHKESRHMTQAEISPTTKINDKETIGSASERFIRQVGTAHISEAVATEYLIALLSVTFIAGQIAGVDALDKRLSEEAA